MRSNVKQCNDKYWPSRKGYATENEEGGGVSKNPNINQDFIFFLTHLTDFLYIRSNGRNVALIPLMSMQKVAKGEQKK